MLASFTRFAAEAGMGGAAGKQTKVKKIYVKGADTVDASLDDEGTDTTDAGRDEVSHFTGAPPNFAEQLAAARSLGGPSEEAAEANDSVTTAAAGAAPGDKSTTMSSEMTHGAVELQGATAVLEDVKPFVNSAILQPSGVKKQDRNEDKGITNTFGYTLSPRSTSSDEGNTITLDNRPQFINPLAARTELFSPKEAFAQVIKESYEKRAQERAAWLKPFGEVAETRQSPPLGGQAFGFNDTRRALPALRDPDACISEEVRKWNVRMNRDEAPPAQPTAKVGLL